MASQIASSVPTKRLAAAILSTDMSFSLNSYTGWDNAALVAGDFSTTGRGVFRNTANTQIEFFTFDPTTIAGPITILTRGNDYKGGTTDGVKTKYSWPAYSTLVELGSNAPAMMEDYVDKISAETIATGAVKTFATGATPIITDTPTTSLQAVNKAYADNLVISGAADSSTTTKGILVLSATPNVTKGTATITIANPAVISFTAHGLIAGDTVQFTTSGALPTGLAVSTNYYVIAAGLTANAFEVSSVYNGAAVVATGSQSGTHTLIKVTPTALSPNDSRVPTANQVLALAGDDTSLAVGSGNKVVTQTGLQNKSETYAVSTGSANAYVLTLSPVPTAYAAGQEFEFTANFTNTGTSTLNVNSLGAITIKKLDGTVVLASGDIVSGMSYKVKYYGGVFQLLSPTAQSIGYNTGFGAVSSATADGAGHQVTADTLLYGYTSAANATAGATIIYSDSVATPTTVRANILGNNTNGAQNYIPFCIPVRKNEYYKITVGAFTSVIGFLIPIA